MAIVKGIKQADGDDVILSEDQVKAAYPKSTQTIGIESFVKASEIPFTLLETPYYLEPVGKGDKVSALLRESMFEAGVIGIARVLMHTKEHLAALIPSGASLVLGTLRWAGEIRCQDRGSATGMTCPSASRRLPGLGRHQYRAASCPQNASTGLTPSNASSPTSLRTTARCTSGSQV